MQRAAVWLCKQDHGAFVQVVDNELCQLALHAVEGANQCVDQHAVKHTKEVTILIVLVRVKEAGAIEENQPRSCQQRKTSTM